MVSIFLYLDKVGYDNTKNENLIYINKINNDLITNKNKNTLLIIIIEIFIIKSFLKKPKNGGSPPKDSKTKIFINFL